jgi:hypothetical protein
LASGASVPSLRAVVTKLGREEGLRGFYRGFLPPLHSPFNVLEQLLIHP